MEVIGGYLIPAPDRQVARKLKGDALPLEDRIKMAKLATRDTQWMVDETSYVGGIFIRVRLHTHPILEKMLKHIEATIEADCGIKATALYVCGGDSLEAVCGFLDTHR